MEIKSESIFSLEHKYADMKFENVMSLSNQISVYKNQQKKGSHIDGADDRRYFLPVVASKVSEKRKGKVPFSSLGGSDCPDLSGLRTPRITLLYSTSTERTNSVNE